MVLLANCTEIPNYMGTAIAATPFQPPIILNDRSCRAEGDEVLAGRDGQRGKALFNINSRHTKLY